MSKIQNFAPAKMGIAAKTMSLAFVITILVMDYFFLDVSRPFQSWLSALLFLGPVALLTIVWFRRVKSYSLMENKIIVQMGSYTREYDIDQIQEIFLEATSTETRSCIEKFISYPTICSNCFSNFFNISPSWFT